MNKWGACRGRGAVVSNIVLRGGGTQEETWERGPYQVRRGSAEAAGRVRFWLHCSLSLGNIAAPPFVSPSGDIPATYVCGKTR